MHGKSEKNQNDGSIWKTVGLIVTLVAVSVYGGAVYLRYSRGIAQPGPESPATRPAGMPSPQEMRAEMQRIATQAGISADQQQKIEEVMRNRDLTPEQRREQMDALTTPEQRQQMMQAGRAAMERHMQQHLQQVKTKLSPEGQVALEQRIARMRENMRNGPTPGEGPPPGGPPPDGGPPPGPPPD